MQRIAYETHPPYLESVEALKAVLDKHAECKGMCEPNSQDLMRILSAHMPHLFNPESPLYLTENSVEQPGPHWNTLGDKLTNWAKGFQVPNPFPPNENRGTAIWGIY